VVAQHADRTGAEPQRLGRQRRRLQGERGIDRRVEEPFERAVRYRVRGDPLEPPRIAEEDEEDRGVADPRHVGDQRSQPVALCPVLDPDHRCLLKVGLRGRRECRCQDQAHHRFGYRPVAVAPLRSAQQHLFDPGVVFGVAAEIEIVAEAGGQLGAIGLAHCSSHAAQLG
jgi:hypothetical protein